MKCVNCGSEAFFVYKNNSLCWHCFELSRLEESLKLRKIRENEKLVKETLKLIKECKYWIKVGRLANKFNYPEIIK